jgi:peptidoglycan/xylan/chitin deacetylase (PgdA/CDA1 family)
VNDKAPKPNSEGNHWLKALSPILTYHEIAPQSSKYIYSVSSHQFEEHLRLFLELNLPSSSKIVVTFDDGKLSDHNFALPLLERHRIPATFFVTVGHIGNQVSHMNWEQLRLIASLGHSVQSHGWSHLLLTKATQSERHQELVRSKKTLEDRLGLPVASISLPGGRWNAEVLRACANAGYTHVYHSDPWKSNERQDNVEFLGRLMVRNTDSVRRLHRLLSRKSADLFRLWVQHQTKEAVKKLLGDDTYQYLWSSVGRLSRITDARQ